MRNVTNATHSRVARAMLTQVVTLAVTLLGLTGGTTSLAFASAPPASAPTVGWNVQASYPAPPQPTAVSCASPTDCVAVGYRSIVATTNGGTTWAAQTLPSGVTGLAAVSCPSPTVCVAVGSTNTGAAVVVTSTTGGSSWTAGTLPVGITYLNGVSCGSISSCVAIGFTGSGPSVAITTANGGKTWIDGALPNGVSNLTGVACGSASNCVSLGFGTAVTTIDGGANWTSHLLASGSNNLPGLSCGSVSRCEAVGTTFTGSGTGGGIAFATTDGGATWLAQSLSEGLAPDAISCPSFSMCIAVGSGSIASTITHGGSWTSGAEPTGVASLAGISCATTLHCVAAGYDNTGAGVAIVTGDGGKTWTTRTVPGAFFGPVALSCAPASHCVGVGLGFIVTTTNNFKSYRFQGPPSGVNDLLGVSCPSITNCVAVGDTVGYNGAGSAGTVIATTDGGTTWTTQKVLSGSTQLGGVSCSSSLDCVAVGYNFFGVGVAVVTTDGGGSWTSRNAPSGIFGLTRVSCSSSADCVAVGTNTTGAAGTVIATTDGGASWTSQTVPSDVSSLGGISCASTSGCEAVGQGKAGSGDGVIIGSATVFGPLVPTTLSVSAGPTSATAGSPVTYSATVSPNAGSGTPTGTVAFFVGTVALCTTVLSGGSGSCTASNAPLGADTVTATYGGDPNFVATWANTTVTVYTITCGKLSGSVTTGYNFAITLSKCSPASKGNRSASGSALGGGYTFTWSTSGQTTIDSLSLAPAPAGACAKGGSEFDITGTVTGGTSTYTQVGDPVSVRVCLSKSGKVSLVSGTTAIV